MSNPYVQTTLVKEGAAVQVSGLTHRVAPPASPGPHPTVVMLHGRAGNEDVMWLFAKTLPPNWLVVAPRGLESDPKGGYVWRRRTPDEWPCLYDFEPAIAALTRFVHALPQLYDADAGRIFFMGFSQGAATAYALAMTYPLLVKGIAGLVGFVPEACDAAVQIQALQGLPIFMAAGNRDPLIPLTRSRESASTLRAAGANLAYHELDTTHKLNGTGIRELRQWWLARATQYVSTTLPNHTP